MTLCASKGYHPAFPSVFLGRPLETLGGPHTDDLPQRVADADEAENIMTKLLSFGGFVTLVCALLGASGCATTTPATVASASITGTPSVPCGRIAALTLDPIEQLQLLAVCR
jgi:hypothetical protein